MKYVALVYTIMMKAVNYADTVVGYGGLNVKLMREQTSVMVTT
jgi:hypothetical protein